MSKPTNAVKDRWNAKNYDDLRIRIPKGRKEDVEAYAAEHQVTINGLVNAYLRNVLEMTEEEWKKNLSSDFMGEA